MDNFEDSEDPAQDSYASPDRQLPFKNQQYQIQQSYGAMGGDDENDPE